VCTLICVTYWNCKSVLYCCINYRASSNCEIITLFFVQYGTIAERLSARLLIVQCGQLAFVCIYVYMYVYIYIYVCVYIYIYIHHTFNCVGAVSVVSSPDY